MTREKVIEMLKIEKECVERQDRKPQCNRYCEACDLCMPIEKVIEAYNMAISALEQNEKAAEWYKTFVEKFESCEDAISREDAYNMKYDKVIDINGVEYVMLSEVQMRLRKLSSVTPIRRKGHWIETEYHRWRCSVCREKGMSEWDNIHDVRSDFCPNCGADMRGAE